MAFQLSVDQKWHAINAVAFGLTFYTLYRASVYAYRELCLVRELTQIRNESSPSPSGTTTADEPEAPEFFTQSTEDAISEFTLGTLAFSPNPDMSDASRRLVIERVQRKPGVWDLLIANIAGLNGRERQEESMTALRYFYQRSVLPQRRKTLRALVHALRKRLPEIMERDHQGTGREKDSRPETAVTTTTRTSTTTDWKERTQGERDALFVLRCEAETNTEWLLHATDIVPMFLAKYPFGGKDALQPMKQLIVSKLIDGMTDDDSLGRILAAIYYDEKSVLGRKQLRMAGLIGSAMREGEMGGGSGGEEGAAGLAGADLVEGVQLYAPPETPGEHGDEDDEARLRRRRRNTVVAEGGDTTMDYSPD